MGRFQNAVNLTGLADETVLSLIKILSLFAGSRESRHVFAGIN